MARTAKVSDQELMERLAKVFRNYGYEGASMTVLAKVTGLQKASLYHRFPGGKQDAEDADVTAAANRVPLSPDAFSASDDIMTPPV